MDDGLLLAINPGSSSIKFALYVAKERPARVLGRGHIDFQRNPITLRIVEGRQTKDIALKAALADDLYEAIDETLACLSRHFSFSDLAAVGHRVVHGGDRFTGPALIDEQTLHAIEALTPLAPLHQPQSLRLIRTLKRLRPQLRQSASFDTAFHRSQTELVRRFALPRSLFDLGVKRYGFHGLSYKYIAAELTRRAPDIARGGVVVAHLGSGASLCALDGGVSRDTSMGFSTLDGVPMATRCGALDPGVLLHLLKQRNMSNEALEDLLYHRSGLLGISETSGDCRELAASSAPEAREALEIFAFRIAREVAALASTIGGLDAVVFTAGIGEHQPRVRSSICRRLAWLGAQIDDQANEQNAPRIDADGSRLALFVIPTDEERVIADEALDVLPLRSAGQRSGQR